MTSCGKFCKSTIGCRNNRDSRASASMCLSHRGNVTACAARTYRSTILLATELCSAASCAASSASNLVKEGCVKMIALRLVRLIEDHSEELAEGLLKKFQGSSLTTDMTKVPASELRDRVYEILNNLGEW